MGVNPSLPCLLSDPSHLRVIKSGLHDLTDWLKLGLELGMDHSFLDGIERDKGGNTGECKAVMLHAWLQSGRATKSSLVTAVRKIGEDDIAARIE